MIYRQIIKTEDYSLDLRDINKKLYPLGYTPALAINVGIILLIVYTLIIILSLVIGKLYIAVLGLVVIPAIYWVGGMITKQIINKETLNTNQEIVLEDKETIKKLL